MLDPELKGYLAGINQHLVEIKKPKSESFSRAFLKGVLHGVGSVLGIAIAVLLIGWFLNLIGVIPGIKQQAKIWQGMWQDTLEQVKRIR